MKNETQTIIALLVVTIGVIYLMLLSTNKMLSHQIIQTQDVKRVITIQASIDGCPCAYEVWETDIENGMVDQDSWRVIYSQDDCEYDQFMSGSDHSIIYHR